MKAFSTLVEFLADVSINSMPKESANSFKCSFRGDVVRKKLSFCGTAYGSGLPLLGQKKRRVLM